jgi:hypothetical protein
MKKLQNDLDQWLIKNWARAHELEESMNRVRTVHQERLQRIAKRVQERYPLPQSPRLIADMILNGKEDQFGDCLLRHMGILLRFIPVVDAFFKTGRKR